MLEIKCRDFVRNFGQNGLTDQVLAMKVDDALPISPQDLFVRTAQFLKQWVDEAEPQQLQAFVRAVTGNLSLGAQTRIRIDLFKPDKKRLPVAHTCFFSLDLPVNYRDYDQFKEKLELFIEASTVGSGFQLA